MTFVVDEKGVIRSRHFEEDYRKRPTVGAILGEPASAGTFDLGRLATRP